MKAEKDKRDVFNTLCLKPFRFLEDEFNCKLVSVKYEFYGTFITYQNSTTAIRVSIEPYDGGVFVFLIRIVQGKIPEYPVSMEGSTSAHWFDLEDLLALRMPSLKIEQPPLDDLFKTKVLEQVLTQYASTLKQCAKDVLQGDFRVFSELENVVKQRAEQFRRERGSGPVPNSGGRGSP